MELSAGNFCEIELYSVLKHHSVLAGLFFPKYTLYLLRMTLGHVSQGMAVSAPPATAWQFKICM